jgi:hypothetical protein
MKPIDEEKWRNRIRRILSLRPKRELRLTPGFQTHEALFAVAKTLPTDFEPYGKRKRSDNVILGDCSCNCRWFHKLEGLRRLDWGVCANPNSPRAGLLTFEHMGCPQYERDKRADYLDTASGRKARRRFEEAEKELQEWRGYKPGLPSQRPK